jgi:hypothetical protein
LGFGLSEHRIFINQFFSIFDFFFSVSLFPILTFLFLYSLIVFQLHTHLKLTIHFLLQSHFFSHYNFFYHLPIKRYSSWYNTTSQLYSFTTLIRLICNFVNLARVWDSRATSKVIIFSWQLLQDRIPIRQNLRRRRVMVGAFNSSCVFCGMVEESVDYLFVSCDRVLPIWYRVSRWLEIEYVSPNTIMQVFESFFGLGVGCRVQLGI